jgi:hypothetical protein
MRCSEGCVCVCGGGWETFGDFTFFRAASCEKLLIFVCILPLSSRAIECPGAFFLPPPPFPKVRRRSVRYLHHEQGSEGVGNEDSRRVR